MIFRDLTKEELQYAYDAVFTEAFPPEELKPLWSIREMIAGGYYRVCGLFEGEKPLGYMALWLDEPFVLIDYLCVPASGRNGGVGGRMLSAVREAFPANTVFIGEVEAPTGNEKADEIIYRRLGFYERSGAKALGYDCALFGVHYRCIYWAEEEIDPAEVMARHDGMYRRRFSPELYERTIQIPLLPGRRPYDRSQWIERAESEEEL